MQAKDLELREDFPMYPYLEYKGWEFPRLPPLEAKGIREHFKDIKNYSTKEDDVIICTAMKTGSHWIHEIVSMLLNQTTEYNTFGPFWELNFENMTQSDKIQQITGTRVFHTHLPFSFLPTKHVQNGYKIVYLNRNPKDRFVSHKCFMDGKLGFPKFTWSQYFEKFVINDKLYTGWFNYTKEMTTAISNNAANIFPVMFEDLMINPRKYYKDLATFLEMPCTDHFIEEIIEKCSFKNLKDNKLNCSAVLDRNKKQTLFRKGVIGDWKNWFTVSQNEKFDALYREQMKDVDVNFIYEYPNN